MTTPHQRNYQRRKQNRFVTDAPRAHPHARLVFALMRQGRVVYDSLAERSGVTRASMKAWRVKNRPSLEGLSAVLGALGWDYVPVPRANKLSPELASEISRLRERFQIEMPEVFAMLLEVSAYQRALAEHGMKAAWQADPAV